MRKIIQLKIEMEKIRKFITFGKIVLCGTMFGGTLLGGTVHGITVG